MQLIVISGRSGSGKSAALNALEDQGFNCTDNFPVTLLESLVEEARQDGRERLAVSVDARATRGSLARFPDLLAAMRRAGLDCRVVYLDAASPTLVKRFSETRRRHPLTDAATDLRQAIDFERELLADIAGLADLKVDTTALSAPELMDLVKTRLGHAVDRHLSLLFQSFAFKSGVPVDADFVFDIRCLANPYWQAELRGRNGLDDAVKEFLDRHDAGTLFDDIRALLESWIPRFEAGHRHYLTVALGCTGGRHRSVYMAERLAAHFRRTLPQVLVRHRELAADAGRKGPCGVGA